MKDVTEERGLELLKAVAKHSPETYGTLQENDLRSLCDILAFVELERGNPLIQEGDQACFLAIVLEGSVAVSSSRNTTTVRLTTGALLGTESYFYMEFRTANGHHKTENMTELTRCYYVTPFPCI